MIERLQQRRAAIHERWLGRTLETYPPDAAVFLKRQRNPFANPVGQTVAAGTRVILDSVLDGADPGTIRSHLEEILKIRAVQEFSPAVAVGFLFLLKDAIRDELASEEFAAGDRLELEQLDARIDRVALLAFDIFVQCREKVYELRLAEVRRNLGVPASWMKRSRRARFVGDPESEPDRAPDDSR